MVEAPVFVSIGAICCIAIQHNSAVQGLDQKDDDDDDDDEDEDEHNYQVLDGLLDPLLFDCQAGGFLTSMVGL